MKEISVQHQFRFKGSLVLLGLLALLVTLVDLALLGGDQLLLTLLNLVDALSLGAGHGDGDGVEGVGNDEHVVVAGGELVALLVAKASNVEATGVTLNGEDLADESSVGAASDHGDGADAGLEGGLDGTGGDVDDDGVVAVDLGVGEADAATVVGGEHGGAVAGGPEVHDLAELDLGLLLGQADHLEAALNVVQHADAVVGLGDLEDIHEAGGVLGVDAGAAVDLNEALADDHLGLLVVEGVLETVTEDHGKGHALTDLVGTSARAGGEDAGELGEHPVLGGEEPLEVLTSHVVEP